MKDLRVFIGFDSREPAAYAVLAHSILARASRPVCLVPLVQSHLRGIYARERQATESTEFSFTRFLVPHLSRYEGYSVFMDCDMLCQVDLWTLVRFTEADPDKAVWVCQHDYTPTTTTKMDGQVQTRYPRKNWSSLMLFHNAKCRTLTRKYVNEATGAQLHQFAWVSDAEIGALPLTWNWLSDEYPPNPHAEILHYTLGGPWMEGHEHCDHADVWLRERDAMLGASPAPASGLRRLTGTGAAS